MPRKLYISASTQKNNIGVGQYGSEQDRMMALADRVKYWLGTQGGKFEVFRNEPNWTLEQTVKHCNSLNCALFIDNHTNAGPPTADGTEVYYHGDSLAGRVLATKLNEQIAPISPGSDRGVLSDTTMYKGGFYVLRETKCPSALIEHIFHTNTIEVNHFIAHMDVYAKATAIGICKYFNEAWIIENSETELLLDKMVKMGLITDKKYWFDVLTAKRIAQPEYLKVVFNRAIGG